MIKNDFQIIVPKSLEHSIKDFKKNSNAMFLAGGTDIIHLMKYQLKTPQFLIDLQKIKELKKIEKQDNQIFIGSMVTLSEIQDNSLVNEYCAIISEAARRVASPQIRNMGTIGGNILQDRRCIYFNQTEYWRKGLEPCFKLGGTICYQIPQANNCRALYYSDMATALLVYDTKVQIYDECGFRFLSLKEVIKQHIEDSGFTRKGKFFITGFLIPYSIGDWSKFARYSVRGSIDFPTINIAIRYSPGNNTTGKDEVRICVGAVAPEPIELNETQQFIINKFPKVFKDKEQVINMALQELKRKSSLIRESGISIKAKKDSFRSLEIVLEKLFEYHQDSI